MLEQVEWGDYRVGDLFEIGTWSLISNDELRLGEVPRISAKADNNWIIGYFDTENLSGARHVENFITVNFFGTDGGIFYHPYKASVEMKVHTLKIPNYELNTRIGNFIVSSLNLSLKGFGYGNQLSSSKLKDLNFVIQLPTRNGNIDFGFMESFIEELEALRIEELEALRIEELEAYLQATGLKDYTLTSEEERILTEFESGKFVWKDYRIEDILDWQPQKEIDPLKLEELKDEVEDFYPFYWQATINNWIISYNQLKRNVLNNKDWKPTILIHSNNQNIVYLESPFYLKDWHGATSVLQNNKLNKLNQMFLVSVIDKVIKLKYSYNNKATKIELKNTIVSVITRDNQPDYTMIETFISAIQKLVIRDVVDYTNRKIEATRKVINK